MSQGFDPPFGHNFNRQTSLKVGSIALPILELSFLAIKKGMYKGCILVSIHRAVNIIGAVSFIITRLKPSNIKIDCFLVNDRSNSIEEGEWFLIGNLLDL